MAAANESQGLKIAVAAFIALTVILTVTSYFLYSAYSAADAKLTVGQLKTSPKRPRPPSLALNQYEDVRGKVGTKAAGVRSGQGRDQRPLQEDRPAARRHDQRGQHRRREGPGGRGPGDRARGYQAERPADRRLVPQRAQQDLYLVARPPRRADGEPVAAVDRALAQLRRTCGRASSRRPASPRQQVDVQTKAAEKSQADVLAEQKKHEDERQILLTKVDELQAANDKQATEIANLTNKIKQQEEDFTRQRETLTTIIREQRDQLEKKELILDRPDGYVTYVDYERREVLVNLTRRQGARPQMKMTIFDADSPGIPTEKPKGNIELTSDRRPVQRRPHHQDRSTRSIRSASATSSTRPPGRPTSRCGSPWSARLTSIATAGTTARSSSG